MLTSHDHLILCLVLCSIHVYINDDDVRYGAVLLVVVIFMLMKYFEGFDEERTREEAEESTETNPLWVGKTVQFSYGTCEEDLESGIRKDNGVNGSCSHSSSQEEDLYDKKVCVICYDEQRNCFFVPCGHCATCYVCAQRYDIPRRSTFTDNITLTQL